jgi:hypothetical protein
MRSGGSSSTQPGWTFGEHSRKVETQGGGYPENVLWTASQVVFGDLDIHGSTTTGRPWFEAPRTQSQIDEVENRTAADLEWMNGYSSAPRARTRRPS